MTATIFNTRIYMKNTKKHLISKDLNFSVGKIDNILQTVNYILIILCSLFFFKRASSSALSQLEIRIELCRQSPV